MFLQEVKENLPEKASVVSRLELSKSFKDTQEEPLEHREKQVQNSLTVVRKGKTARRTEAEGLSKGNSVNLGREAWALQDPSKEVGWC